MVGGETLTHRQRIDQSTTVIRLDLDQLISSEDMQYETIYASQQYAGQDPDSLVFQSPLTRISALSIFDSREEEEAVTTPVVLTAVYRSDPATLAAGDVVGQVNNLLFFDFKYLKMGIDRDYASVYLSKWNEREVQHAVMRPVVFVVGCAMIAAGIYTLPVGGGAMALFGADMVASSLFGWSLLDKGLSGYLYLAFSRLGKNTTFMHEESFSFFQFTSIHAVNLVLTQLTFMAVAGPLSGFKGLKQVMIEQARAAGGLPLVVLRGGWTNALRTGLRELWSYLPTGSSARYNIALRYLWHQGSHLLCGATFLYAIGAIGSSFGDASLLAEVGLQMTILASVIVSVKQTQLMKWVESSPERLSAYSFLEQQVRNNEQKSGELMRWLGIAKMRATWSVFGGTSLSGPMTMLLSLGLASKCLQVATVIAQGVAIAT